MIRTSLNRLAKKLLSPPHRLARVRKQSFWRNSIQSLEARILLCGDPPYEPPVSAQDDWFYAGEYNQGFGFGASVAWNDENYTGGTYSIWTQPQYGTVSLESNGNFTYTPDGVHAGSFTFTYRLADSVSYSDATVTLDLYNYPPSVSDDGPYFSLDYGTLTISAEDGLLVNDDLDPNETNVATKLTDPVHGTLTVNSNGSFSYTPEALYPGLFWFNYQVSDGAGGTATATATIEVGKVTVERYLEYQGDVWIGEYVPLQAVVTGGTGVYPGGMTFSWSLSGQTLKDYVNDYYTAPDGSTQPRAFEQSLSAADKSAEYITFGWTSEGAQTASVTVSLNGQTSTGQIEINVLKPTFDYYALAGGITLSNLSPAQGGGVGAALGSINPFQAGIVFHAPFETWDPDPREVGAMGVVQTAIFSASRTLADGTVQEISASGADNGDGDHDGASYDTPNLKLMENARLYSVSYSFDTYLKWKGPRPGFWVGVSVVHWWFNYEYTSQNGTTWTPVGDPSGTLNQRIEGVDGVYFPTYYGDIAWAAGGRTTDHDLGGWGTPD